MIKSLIIPYLDKRQPVQLQKLSIEALKKFCLLNSDIIWLYIRLIVDFNQLEVKNIDYSSVNITFKYTNLMIDNQLKSELLNIYQSI